MVMVRIDSDFDKRFQSHWDEAPAEYPTAPPGEYIAHLVGLRKFVRSTKNGPRGFIRAIFEVTHGEHKGKTAYWEGWFTADDRPTKETKRFFSEIGVNPFTFQPDETFYSVWVEKAPSFTAENPWFLITRAERNPFPGFEREGMPY